MATLFNEIFYAIRGKCITDEAASVAAAEVADLVAAKVTSTDSGSSVMLADIKEKLTEFIASQKNVPSEFTQAVNDNFWDLI